LKQEQHLAEIVRLIGPDALPDDQRLVLISAEILKNGFLQQNSYDDVDMYCVPAKQVRLLELIMSFHRRAQLCIKLGAPLTKITSLAIQENLSRLKSLVNNDALEGLDNFEREMKASLEDLERSYRDTDEVSLREGL
jgi:V/A-type H+-transporting ATPase subunit A